MQKKGCRTIYAKILSANDNRKQQVYFGGDFKAINLIPFEKITPDPVKTHIYKASLNFYWLLDDGSTHHAENSQLILYPQYPEVRFSGFLRGCPEAPSDLMDERLRMPGRVLFMGMCPDGRIIGYLCHPETDLAKEVAGRKDFQKTGVFLEIKSGVRPTNEREMLLAKLRQIHMMGRIRSRRLDKSGATVPCEAPNCGGFTLEAELGIRPNSLSEPDYLGYEVKQYKVADFTRITSGVLTLMTPEPTGGYYKTDGVEAFVRRFGYPDMSGNAGRDDRLNFGGIHKVGEFHERTALAIVLNGFNAESGKIVNASGGITMINREGVEAAVWGFAEIMTHWNRKHAKAVYVPSISTKDPLSYSYGNLVQIGDGTDFVKYLQAMASGQVYYDPGIKLENASTAPKTKRRSQFRIKSSDLPSLYNTMETIDVMEGRS